MINNNTLLELNKTKFGANINRLESYIIDRKYIGIIEGQLAQTSEYTKYCEILKNIKPKSDVFSPRTDLEPLENTKYDSLLCEYPEVGALCIYGISDENMQKAYSHLSTNNESIDITAIPSTVGIAVSVTYLNGNLYKVYVVNDSIKYMDITDDIKQVLTSYIDEIKDNRITDFRGIITLDSDEYTPYELKCEIMHKLRTHMNKSKLKIVFHNVYSENKDYGSLWERIEFIKALGLNVPHHALIRNVDNTIITDATQQLKDHFHDLKSSDTLGYVYNGIRIFNNNTMSSFVYNYKDCEVGKVFESTIKAIVMNSSTNGINMNLKVVEHKCNDELIISDIDVTDALDIVNLNLSIGNKVKFIVENRKAVIYKS